MAATGLATGAPRYFGPSHGPSRAGLVRRPGATVARVPDPVSVPAPNDGGVSGTPTVLYQVEEGVARITINRPERRNAMSWEVMRGLRQALAGAADDPEVRVVVLAGAGDDAFCAGADLGKMTGADEPDAGVLAVHEARGVLVDVFDALWGLGKPTVARVQGFALAGGFGLALACDLVVASDRARFGAPEVNVGLWPYMITVPLVRSMPPKQALELMLTGRIVDAAEALQLGFVTRVVPPADLDTAVLALAATLAAKSPAVMKLGRDAFYAVWDMAAPDALAHLHAMLSLTAQTEDAAEGIAAFLEKRAPRWRGR
jgi:enoyl-CoA hydratase/carnithine racemase